MDALYDLLLGRWLWMLFRHGPLTLGFWKGLADPDICARIAHNSEARDWVTPLGSVTPACTAMIDREFKSFAVVTHSTLYIATCVVLVTSVAAALRQAWASHLQVQAFSKALALTFPQGAPMHDRPHQLPREPSAAQFPHAPPAKPLRPPASPSSLRATHGADADAGAGGMPSVGAGDSSPHRGPRP